MSSVNDIVFFRLNPISAKRTGTAKIVLKGQIAALRIDTYYSGSPEQVARNVPLGELEITIYVPWFT
jgi:hypothetical protein